MRKSSEAKRRLDLFKRAGERKAPMPRPTVFADRTKYNRNREKQQWRKNYE